MMNKWPVVPRELRARGSGPSILGSGQAFLVDLQRWAESHKEKVQVSCWGDAHGWDNCYGHRAGAL